MPDKMRGFKMEPKGAYMKMMDDRGIPKYGLKKVTHLSGTENEHTHNERPSHGNTPEAHNVPVKKMHSMKKMEEPMNKMHTMKKMEEPLKDMHLKKMEDDAMKAMRDPVAKMKEPMAAMKDPMAKMDPIKKYEEAMPKMMDPAKKMRTGSLMRKDYGTFMKNKATEAELQAAKENAVANGFDPKVAEDVFAKYEVK